MRSSLSAFCPVIGREDPDGAWMWLDVILDWRAAVGSLVFSSLDVLLLSATEDRWEERMEEAP